MKLHILILPTIMLFSCTNEVEKAEFTVEHLAATENRVDLEHIIMACRKEVENGLSPEVVSKLPNCKNAALAIQLRKERFNDLNNTKRRPSVRAFPDEVDATSEEIEEEVIN